jgi:hypothetical protein
MVDKYSLGGDSPLSIVIRLLVLSLIVGIILSALGINPANLFSSLNVLARHIYDMGFGAVEWVLRYVVIGAMIVVPIWLVAQVLTRMRKPRT